MPTTRIDAIAALITAGAGLIAAIAAFIHSSHIGWQLRQHAKRSPTTGHPLATTLRVDRGAGGPLPHRTPTNGQ